VKRTLDNKGLPLPLAELAPVSTPRIRSPRRHLLIVLRNGKLDVDGATRPILPKDREGESAGGKGRTRPIQGPKEGGCRPKEACYSANTRLAAHL